MKNGLITMVGLLNKTHKFIMNREIDLEMINMTSDGEDLLLQVKVKDNSANSKYKYNEYLAKEELDGYVIDHIDKWTKRGYKININKDLFLKLRSSKKHINKEMLR